MDSLADRIRRHTELLVQQALERMYTNPYWDERYGERGRRLAEEDGRHHVSKLVTALRHESPGTIADYARWLQVLLTSRGFCSRQLAENFSRLAEAIEDQGIPEAEQAVAYLRAAEDALVYSDGPARAVQAAAGALASQAVVVLYARHPEWSERWGEAGRAHCLDDLLYHLSYVADGVALGKTHLFAGYTVWIGGFLAGRGIPIEHLAETLAALDEVLGALPTDARDAARAVLTAGRLALAKGAE